MSRVFPPRSFLDAVVVRTTVLWVFLRCATGVLSAATEAQLSGTGWEGADAPLSQALAGPMTAFALFAVILLLLRLEMARRCELVFLANLGYSFRHVGLVVALEGLTLRIALV